MSSSKKTKKKTNKNESRKSQKHQQRINNSKSRKNETDKIYEFVKYYDTQSLDNNSIILESNHILEQLDLPRHHNRHELLYKFEALKVIMEQRLIDTYNTNFDYIYPDYYDRKFNTKIFSKKEFKLNKIPKKDAMSNDEKEEYSQKMCNPSKDKIFKLTPNQKFLKSFMSPNTPYNSILLYHGTGVGKTCSSISIAEQYSQELNESNKKIIILLNPSIKANFQKNIFNIQKVKENLPYYQCTGEKYLKEINVDNLSSISNDVLESKINKIIKNRYEFYGYKQFANIITKLQDTIKTRFDKKDFSKIFEKKIKEMFSNSVMIIDEVHNIKKGVDTAYVSPLLEKVIKIADNMKLLLLSATPMFDTSKEIIFLINLMLMNDNRPTIKASDFFDKHEKLIESKKVLFESKIRGYISYMRGEDPFRFPERIYPPNTIKFKNMPVLDTTGNVISNPITTLNIIGCVMEGYQKKIYEKMDTNLSTFQYNKKETYGSFNQKAIMCSNMIFPNKDMKNIDNYKVEDFVSETGFSNILTVSKGKYKFKNATYKSIFKLENLKKYSTKIAKIIEHIKKNADKPGIIFIYSQFINNGIIPLALALEYLGYSKYNGSLIEDRIKQKGKYIIISGNKDLSNNAYSDYIKLQSLNKHGEKIKIILGSESAAEGLDFSYIREVHILDPWHHLNKIEQVIGRGIRNCSHIELDKDQRNVTIYLYASIKSVNPSKDIETIDLKIYRTGEEKSKQMGEIEYLLKINSVDCEVNIEGNKFETDIDGSKKCNYKECDYKCELDTTHPETSNTLSMNESIIQDSIDETKRDIIELFKKAYIYKLDDLIRELEKEELVIFLALNDLILNKVTIKTHNKSGHIIYRNQHYIFNKHNSSKFGTFNSIKKENSKRNNSYNISNNVVLNQLKVNTSKKVKPNFVFANQKNEKMDESGKSIMDETFPTTKKIPINQVIKSLNNMKINKKEKLLQYLITRYNDKDILITNHESYILEHIYNVLYNSSGNIWGYKIVYNNNIVYKKYNNGIFEEPTKEEVIIMKKQFEQTKKKQKPPAQIIGYYEIKKSDNSILFKIRDKNDEGKKGTQKKTGSICNNSGMKKDKIIQYIEFSLGKVKYSNRSSTNLPKKPDLCYELETIFLSAQSKYESKFRYLYNVEETIEYELNKK